MKAAFSRARSLQMKQHSQLHPSNLAKEPLQKTDSKAAKDETKATLCRALQEGAVLRFTDSRSSLPHMNVLNTNIEKEKRGRPSDPDRARALVRVVLLITQEFVFTQHNL